MRHRRSVVAGLGVALVVSGCTGGGEAGDAPAELAYVTTSTTEVSTTTTEAAMGLLVGDCLATVPGGSTSELGAVESASCDDAHAAEIYYAFALPEGAFPQGTAIEELGHDGCYETFEDFVGTPYELSTLVFGTVLPDEPAWLAGDREVLCVLSTLDGSPLTAPARNSAL